MQSAAFISCSSLILWLVFSLPSEGGNGFYSALSHGVMLMIFVPASLLPLIAISIGLRRYWRDVEGQFITLSDLRTAISQAANMQNLGGGQGQGCNFEEEDKFSNSRRYAHQFTMYGFLLCFASTLSGTFLHYILNTPAPYSFFSLPKLLGIPGGVLLVLGTGYLATLKIQADTALGAISYWGGEMAFVLLLGLTGLTGLLLYGATGTVLVVPFLSIHLGAVLGFFLTTPYSKMAHGFYRIAALVKEAQLKRGPL